jgi:ankyrin repeat protein
LHNDGGHTVLHYACGSETTLDIVKLLIHRRPELVNQRDTNEGLPIHTLCFDTELGEASSLEILKFLLERTGGGDDDDISRMFHDSVCRNLVMFCKHLLDRYPRWLKESADGFGLPIHSAARSCSHSSVQVVEYLASLYPESLDVEDPCQYISL